MRFEIRRMSDSAFGSTHTCPILALLTPEQGVFSHRGSFSLGLEAALSVVGQQK